LGVENVVAAWYSSMLLLLVAAACGVAFALDRRRQVAGTNGPSHHVDYAWIVFGCGFAALSLDEIGSFHERIGMMTSLNRASWLPHQATPVGWVVLFAVPIAAFAMGMLAFGWLRLRHAPWALALFAVGVGLYLCDPLLEVFEGAVKDGVAHCCCSSASSKRGSRNLEAVAASCSAYSRIATTSWADDAQRSIHRLRDWCSSQQRP
jgi:hypothetical protein